LPRQRVPRSGRTDPTVHGAGAARSALPGTHQDPGRGCQPDLRGAVPKIRKTMLSKDRDSMQSHVRQFVDRAVTFAACPECDGTRLNDAVRSCRIAGVTVDQAAIRGSRRSNPATYTGALDPIRKAFARANGVKPGLFSPNSYGTCTASGRVGTIHTDHGMAEGMASTYESQRGK